MKRSSLPFISSSPERTGQCGDELNTLGVERPRGLLRSPPYSGPTMREHRFLPVAAFAVLGLASCSQILGLGDFKDECAETDGTPCPAAGSGGGNSTGGGTAGGGAGGASALC